VSDLEVAATYEHSLAAQTTKANKQAISDFFGAWQIGDFARMEALVDPDGDWWTLGNRKTRKIAEQVQRNRAIWHDSDEGITFTIHTLTAEEDRVAAALESQASFGPQGGYNNLYHFLFELHDGRIRSARVYYDTALAARVLDGVGGGTPIASHVKD
jgi:ketosteroid isomerase-like protein